MKKTPGRWMALAALGVALASSAAFAQADPGKKDTTVHPPTPSKPDEPPYAMGYVGALLVVGLVGFAALIPSKRGHQD